MAYNGCCRYFVDEHFAYTGDSIDHMRVIERNDLNKLECYALFKTCYY